MLLKRLIRILCSLQLTMVLLALSLILVFLGTMAQEPLGLYIAQARFFHSSFVDAASMLAALKKAAQLLNIYVTPMQADEVLSARWIPVFPGGYFLGGALLLNLLAAHWQRFVFTRKKAGIFLTHVGLIILLLGQLFTDQLARESGIHLTEGETKSYSESDRRSELAVIDVTDAAKDRVVAIPDNLLVEGATLADSLPFSIRVAKYYEHSHLTNRADLASSSAGFANQGFGLQVEALPLPKVTDMDFRDVPSAYIELSGPEGSLGRWLVSGHLERGQSLSYKGRSYRLALRLQRHYYPFSLTLLKFSHDKYRGTDTPRNFSSDVRLQNPSTREDREIRIYMNNPLRYAGLTFYQASFDKRDDRATILQVVRNPSWLAPYIACGVVALGLVIQFLIHLVAFLGRRKA
ncbi:MAG: cytochrome c biogenesis protein ResB [Verrucomicrobia bacterium]|nr:cytochrome c biogenesis protein ResB [Verrucomicrobiota bacterium]MBI3870857.1 cytochrome c biogenesis protein ResB [Verrucomicrobiota bacterium]